MKRIELTKGMFALVDDSDFERVNQYKWYAWYCKATNSYYARRKTNQKDVVAYMHRFILEVRDSLVLVDHYDHDTLNNQRENLRECTKQQNNCNRKIGSTNTSGYKGVSWNKRAKKWMVTLKFNKQNFYYGLHINIYDAVVAYNNAAIKHFGEFAFLNELPIKEEINVSPQLL